MITGDNMETAINIGYSTKLLNEHTLLRIEGNSEEEA